jgi:hypothetical protein
MLKIPVSLGVVAAGSNVNLSWKSQGATSYQIQYKNDLGDLAWTNLEVVAGTGLIITRSYPAVGARRFYRVLTL